MRPADDKAMKAALAVLTRATITARMMGYEGASVGLSPNQSAKLADLMDAVHNIPDLLSRWQDCDEDLLVSMLKDYDDKWGTSLAGEYERVRAGAG